MSGFVSSVKTGADLNFDSGLKSAGSSGGMETSRKEEGVLKVAQCHQLRALLRRLENSVRPLVDTCLNYSLTFTQSIQENRAKRFQKAFFCIILGLGVINILSQKMIVENNLIWNSKLLQVGAVLLAIFVAVILLATFCAIMEMDKRIASAMLRKEEVKTLSATVQQV